MTFGKVAVYYFDGNEPKFGASNLFYLILER